MSEPKKRGGKREGAGRPTVPERPMPISWRPDTQDQRDAWFTAGGAKWLKGILDAYINAGKKQKKEE